MKFKKTIPFTTPSERIKHLEISRTKLLALKAKHYQEIKEANT